jgi:AraC-like DNA-binding protein
MKSYKTEPIPELGIEAFGNTHPYIAIKNIEELNGSSRLLNRPYRTKYFEIILVSSGSGEVNIDSHKYILTPGALFASSNGPVKKFTAGENMAGCILLFTPGFLYKYPEDFQWMNSLSLFDSNGDFCPVKLSEEVYGDIFTIIEKINREINSESGFAKNEILFNSLKTIIILSERAKRGYDSREKLKGGNSVIVYEFRNLLEENYNNQRMVAFYADNLNITPRKLNKIISEHYGKSVKQIIEERVLIEVKRLIIHTEKNIKEIGHTLGFTDPTNFNKFFKKYTNTTPADFRLLFK